MLIDDRWDRGSDDLGLILSRVVAVARQAGGSPAAVRRAAQDAARQLQFHWSAEGDAVKISTRRGHVGYVYSQYSKVAGVYRYLVNRHPDDIQPTPATSPERVPWELLPPGEHPFERLVEHLRALAGARSSAERDETRLHRIRSLNPSETYRGLEEFEGYIVFYFRPLMTAVLDCPWKGNAIYVIRGENWTLLSRLTKKEILGHHGVTRFVHSGKWFDRLKRCLEG